MRRTGEEIAELHLRAAIDRPYGKQTMLRQSGTLIKDDTVIPSHPVRQDVVNTGSFDPARAQPHKLERASLPKEIPARPKDDRDGFARTIFCSTSPKEAEVAESPQWV